MEVSCVLCGSPGALSHISDYGNRTNFACVSERCGTYVITNSALRRLESAGPQKSVLIEMARRAKLHTKMLEIFVASDGMLQVTELPCS